MIIYKCISGVLLFNIKDARFLLERKKLVKEVSQPCAYILLRIKNHITAVL